MSSAEGRSDNAKPAVLGITEQPDLALSLLASRSASWAVARENARQAALDEAITIAQQARADEAARLAEEARVATEQAMKSEAARKQAEAARAAAAAAAKKAAAATTTTKKPAPAPAPAPKVASGDPTPEQWAKLRSCESGGNYQALSAGGRFRGAYQFSQGTWDWVAGQVAPQLVGVDPIEAAPGDQDNMAINLYHMRGAGQWPVCGRFLS